MRLGTSGFCVFVPLGLLSMSLLNVQSGHSKPFVLGASCAFCDQVSLKRGAWEAERVSHGLRVGVRLPVESEGWQESMKDPW